MSKDLQSIIAQFKKETRYTLEVKGESLYYSGSLDLRGTGITSLPDNLTVGGSLDLEGCTSISSLPDSLTVERSLYLEGCTSISSLPDNLTVGGDLYLRGTAITSLPDNLTVGGSLDLRGTGITSLPDNLTVGYALDLEGCTAITSLPDNLTVGGSLDLQGTAVTSLPDNLTVGGYLDLQGTAVTSLPDNLTVGGSLDLRGTGITSLPDNLAVGGDIYLYRTGLPDAGIISRALTPEQRKRINDAKCRPIIWERRGRKYIKADGEFTVIDNHHGNVYRVHYLGSDKQLYLVTDGENHWAHGKTLAEARADLIYKISDRDTSAYKNMRLDDTLTFEEAIAAYRTITGACAAGTRNFIENRLPQPRKEQYTIREMLQLTKGEYGSETFARFFNVHPDE